VGWKLALNEPPAWMVFPTPIWSAMRHRPFLARPYLTPWSWNGYSALMQRRKC